MSKATIHWVNGKQFIGIDSTNHSVVISTPGEGTGMRPTDLLLTALGSCTAVDIVSILSKKRMPLNNLEILVTGEQDTDPPWAFRKINIKYILGGKSLTEKAVTQAISLSEGSYCSVAATIRGNTQITTEFEILPENK